MSKEYLFGELEKLIGDKEYYLRNPEKKKEFVEKTESILTKLKECTFDKEEKKTFFNIMRMLKKLKQVIK